MASVAPRVWLFPDYNQAESRVVAWRGPVPKLKRWYLEGQDVHLNMTKMIAEVIQRQRIIMPNKLFTRKHFSEFIKGDEEREQTKRIVHGGNYEVGIDKVALILRVPREVAKILVGIYFTLNPEIRTNYHVWIRNTLKATHTLWMPEPVRFRKVFWDILDDDTYRQAYAAYPQSTVGAMLNRTLSICANVFKNDLDEKLKDQWCAWYGSENWDLWRMERDGDSKSPQAILWSGMDIRLNVHDAGGISIPNEPSLIEWAARLWKTTGETPILIEKDDPMVIPIDFKIGPSWSGDDLKEYKLPAAA
jgi:DNA polymerase I - 3''-5'' exonuclease and polymerase domains